jgi:hypothetical protein
VSGSSDTNLIWGNFFHLKAQTQPMKLEKYRSYVEFARDFDKNPKVFRLQTGEAVTICQDAEALHLCYQPASVNTGLAGLAKLTFLALNKAFKEVENTPEHKIELSVEGGSSQKQEFLDYLAAYHSLHKELPQAKHNPQETLFAWEALKLNKPNLEEVEAKKNEIMGNDWGKVCQNTSSLYPKMRF